MTNKINTYHPNMSKLFALKSFLINCYSKITYNYQTKYNNLRNKVFESLYTEAINTLFAFTRNYSFSNLIKAAQKFVEASKLNPESAGPFIHLAWLYFIAEDKDACQEYLALAEKAEPNFPDMLKIKRLMLAC